MKKYLYLLMAAVMLISCTACNTGPVTSGDTSSKPYEQTDSSTSVTIDDNDGFESEAESFIDNSSTLTPASSSIDHPSSNTSTTTPTSSSTESSIDYHEDAFSKLNNPDLHILCHFSQEQYRDQIKEGSLPNMLWHIRSDFQRKYGGKVTIEYVPFNEMITKTVAMQKAGKAPDIIQNGDQFFPSTAVQKVVQPLEQLVDSNGNKVSFDKSLWSAETLSAFKYNGKTYAISDPTYKPTLTFIYFNETMFKKEGLTSPKELYKQGKWNWAEFEKACKKLAKSRNGTLIQKSFSTYTIPSLFMISNNASILTFDSAGKAKANLTDDKVMSTLQFLYDALQPVEKGGFMDYKGPETFQADFANGILGMQAGVAPTANVTFDWDLVPMPVGPDNKENRLASAVYGFSIPTGAKNPEGAMAYIYFMSNPKYMEENKAAYIKSLSGQTAGKIDTAKGQWNYENYIMNSNLKYASAMDRNFSGAFTLYWNICMDMANGDKPATIAAKYQQSLQAALDTTYG